MVPSLIYDQYINTHYAVRRTNYEVNYYRNVRLKKNMLNLLLKFRTCISDDSLK